MISGFFMVMYSLRSIALVLCGILLFNVRSDAQDRQKQEVEKRIRMREMPEKAIQLLTDWLEESNRIRFYYETDGDKESYEAKLTWAGRKFSIEFDASGVLLDIEELVSIQQLPESVRESIIFTLGQTYDKHIIRRIQRQFLPQTSGKALLSSLLSTSEVPEYEDINYELEVDVKEQSRARAYEILFDAGGQVVQRRLVVRRSLDNFLY